ncbi:High mobility group protein B1 [Sciurus carolinensis]|uniref:High mobility group protein B1 n=1 Tax=Sciurus carolinensis TaxID=30640 RepID=A0AA41N686_SCICA|nr:High mobility group protein B1 [Sciurus carolinensis]
MSAKEKGKFEDMAEADKAHYEREMKTYIPPKGESPYEKQAAKLNEKYEKNIAAYQAKVNTDAAKKGVVKAEKSKKKKEEEEDEDNEQGEEEEDEDEEG